VLQHDFCRVTQIMLTRVVVSDLVIREELYAVPTRVDASQAVRVNCIAPCVDGLFSCPPVAAGPGLAC
jgi:hypothetical protein